MVAYDREVVRGSAQPMQQQQQPRSQRGAGRGLSQVALQDWQRQMSVGAATCVASCSFTQIQLPLPVLLQEQSVLSQPYTVVATSFTSAR